MNNKLSLSLIAILSLALTLLLAQPGLAGPLFNSPIPPPTQGEAIWCADIESSFTPGPGAGEMSFVATLTNTTYVTTPVAYPLNIPEGRVQVGVWQEQRRRQTNTGYLFGVPATDFLATAVISGTFPAPANGSPVRYYLRLWDEADGAWGRTGCELPPEVVNPPAAQPPPPQPLAPPHRGRQATYDPITFTWQPPDVADGVAPVLDYELEVTWGDGSTRSLTTTLTQTVVALPAAQDQMVGWRLRSRNSAGYGRWSDPAWDYGIDATAPALTPIIETHGVISGTWQNMVSSPVFTWAGSDPQFGSGLSGYWLDWTPTLPCAPAVFTTTTVYSTTATGVNYLCVQARDLAGNASPVRSFEFRYDAPGVSLDIAPDFVLARPGQTLDAVLTVTNESLAADVFTQTAGSGPWTLSGLPGTLALAGSGALTSSAVQSRALTLDIPADAADGDGYIVPITATGRTGNFAMESIVVTVSRPDALVVAGADDQTGRSGETLTYTLALTNGAAVPVTFDLSAGSTWPVSLPLSLTVAGQDVAHFEVSVSIPAGAAHGQANAAAITATNRAYPTFILQTTITGTASRSADDLTVTPPAQVGLPSQDVAYTVTLTNGSGVTDTFDLAATAAWPVSLADSVAVEGGAGVEVPVSVLVPGGVLSGTVHTATLSAASRANPAVQPGGVITTVVGRVDRLQIQLLPPARVLNVAAGEVATTTATVWYQNGSNYVDDLAASAALPSGWSGGVQSPQTFLLDPLAGRLGQVALTIPATAGSGAYQAPVTLQGLHAQSTAMLDVVVVREEAAQVADGVYLPLIVKAQSSPRPDLVGSFTFAGGAPVVTVENVGQAAAEDFWVDFYVDPAPAPDGANQPWDYLCSVPQDECQGIAWYVSTEIAPGGSLTLRLADAYPPNTRWSGVSGAHEFYVYVDSWNPTVSTGAVLESDEGNNRSYQVLLVSSVAAAGQVKFEPVAGRVRRGE